MTYRDTARRFARAEKGTRAGFTPTPEALAADKLPVSAWAESRRYIMTPETVAANHALHVSDTAHALREALSAYGDRNPDPEGGSVAQLTIAARALLAAIGEGE